MARWRRFVPAAALAAWAGLVVGCGSSEPPAEEATESSPLPEREKPVFYTPPLQPPDEPERPESMTWASPGEEVGHGDLRIRVAGVEVGKVALRNANRKAIRSKDEVLVVRLALTNANPSRKVDYRSWSGDPSPVCSPAVLRDSFGNGYKQIDFPAGTYPVGAVPDGVSIYPNKEATDVLVFEAPLDTAAHLDLELPAKNFGGTGTVRYRIPMATVSRATASEPSSPGAR